MSWVERILQSSSRRDRRIDGIEAALVMAGQQAVEVSAGVAEVIGSSCDVELFGDDFQDREPGFRLPEILARGWDLCRES